MDARSPGHTNARTRSWRIATTVRAFGLAFVLGLTLRDEVFGSTGLVLLALGLVAVAASMTERGALTPTLRWIPVVEGAVVAVLLGAAQYDASLAPYLIVPPLVAGARHGWVPALNTAVLILLVVIVGVVVTADGSLTPIWGANLPWAVLGAAGGLLAGWQTRALRLLEETQAPYAAAHQMLAQLHELTERDSIGFDPVGIAQGIIDALRSRSGAATAAVVVSSGSGDLTTLLGTLPASTNALDLGRCLEDGATRQGRATAYLPIRLNDRIFGVVVLGHGAWDGTLVTELQAMVDREALRLETALLFGEMRDRATSEERSRLARELHDGVAQEVVALGYLIDELEDQVTDPIAGATASSLRQEVHRILGDLRFSVFDLRHETVRGGLADALATYAREVRASSGIQVHLVLDDVSHDVPHRAEAEMLRIAQEAVGNARRHADAQNLWISLSGSATGVTLRIEDDGVGGATPLAGHYGMHTMRERAERIGARFSFDSVPGSGTVLTVECLTDAASTTRSTHELHSSAGR